MRLNYVWIYTHYLCELCWWIYRIVIMYIVIFLYLHLCIILCTYWRLVWINRYTWTHWWTIYIGQKFYTVHRIIRQEIGQWGRWIIHNYINKNIHHYGWCQLFLKTINRFSEPTHFNERSLERYFENIVEKVPIMCTYRGVQKDWSWQVTVYFV